MTRFNWDDMQFFLALARDGQLTGAARQLGSSHVTVARRIERLEASLRQRLFERSARGYELTASGRRLVDAAERMDDASERINTGEATVSGLAGSFRIAVPEGFSSFFTERILAAFLEYFPAISLELITMTQVLSLSRREADLTVTLDPVAKGAYRSEHLADYVLRIYGASDYLAAHPPIKSREDLRNHRFFGYIEETLFTPSLDYLAEIHADLRPTFKSSSIFNQLAATRQKLGLSVLPCYLAQNMTDLVPVLGDEVCLRRKYWLTCHADTRQMRRERTIISFMTDEIARHSTDLLL
jgi:DNA-binding transcriptional LysR family regulator